MKEPISTTVTGGLDRAKYWRRRQFALGPGTFTFPGWNTYPVANQLQLTLHPDLPLTTCQQEGKRVWLLGYWLDPLAPEKDDQELAHDFVEQLGGLGDVIQFLDRLSGRFVLVVKQADNLWLFHDAVALRQVQYCRDGEGRIWCASQAETLAERLGYPLDEEVLAYRNLAVFRENRAEFWLLNNRTPYRQIRNLLPNHYLDLKTGQATRYWPRKGCLEELSVSQSIRLCTPILKNTIRSAAERFDLRMGISAGIDSRKTLAATRDVRDRIYYFTHAPAENAREVNDVKVPARLLPRLGLQHHNLGWHPMSREFAEMFSASATWAREKKGHIAHTLWRHFGTETTVLNSNISEVAQCVYWLPPSQITGLNLAIITGLKHPLAIQEFQNWIDGSRAACDEAHLDILALFFLEQRMGRWATAAFAEYDLVHETFNPYNNRHLHCLMLGVKERHRRDRRWDVSLKHIKCLWPEVLQEAINPQDRLAAKIQQTIRRYLLHQTITPWVPLYQYLRFYKKRRKFNKQIFQ